MKEHLPSDAGRVPAATGEASVGQDEHAAVLALQQSAGNAAVNALLTSGAGGRMLLRNGPHATATVGAAEARDIAHYEGARRRHDANRARVQGWLTAGAAQTADRRLKNSCEWANTGRARIYVLTKTHDSTARCAAAGHPGGAAWFSYPAGELSSSAVYYTRHTGSDPWDNANVNFEDSPTVDGFNDSSAGVIALMETAIASGRSYFYSVLKHEVQHAADHHGTADLERYKSEFRAYWLGSGEFNHESATRRVNHLGREWTARQWAIFNNMYNDTAYAYVKAAWDAENSEPDRTRRTFQNAVVNFSTPESVNPENSIRVDAFYTALQAASYADCTADSAAHPNARITAVRDALNHLEAPERADVRGNRLFDGILTAHLNGAVLTEIQAALAR